MCRVYKNYDPRATIMKQVVEDVFEITGKDPLLDVAVELERIARSDEFFIKRKLYPNVDFYSGEALHAVRLPPAWAGRRQKWISALIAQYCTEACCQLCLGLFHSLLLCIAWPASFGMDIW